MSESPLSEIEISDVEDSPEDPKFSQDVSDAVAALAKRRGAALIDYARPSPITLRDDNYWDPLHFRLPIARRLEGEISSLAKGGPVQPDGAARVIVPAR